MNSPCMPFVNIKEKDKRRGPWKSRYKKLKFKAENVWLEYILVQIIMNVVYFAGNLFPVNERAARTIRNLYVENERVIPLFFNIA